MRTETAPVWTGEERTLAGTRETNWRRRAGSVVAFAATTALILVYGLRGGSYDHVIFQEHGLVIWWLLGLGIAFGLLPRARLSRPALLLIGALGAYAGWTALSLLWTQSSERTVEEIARVLDYLGVVALVGCALDRYTWRSGAAGLGFGAFAVCGVALCSHLAPSLFGVDHLDAALHINRLSVPFGYWNAVGAFGAMSTAIGLAWSAHDTVKPRRMVALAGVSVAVTSTYLTYSRASIGGVALAMLAVLLLSRNRLTVLLHSLIAAVGSLIVVFVIRGAPEIAHATGTAGAGRVWLALAGAVALAFAGAFISRLADVDGWRIPQPVARPARVGAAVVILGLGASFGPHLASRVWHSFTRAAPRGTQTTTNPTARLASLSGTRYPLWKVTLQAFDAHPADGTGAGTFEFWWNRHATNDGFVRDAHNLWLQNLAELGLPGLVLIVAVAASALWTGLSVRRRARRPTSAGVATAFLAAFVVYLLHASVDWMWESTAVTVLALAGIAVLSPRTAAPLKRVRWSVRSLLVLACAVAVAVQIPGLLSTTEIRRSQHAARAGALPAALSWARDAVSAEPWSASAYEQRGLVEEQSGALHPAAQDLTRAIGWESTNYRHWLIRARIETELGEFRLAEADYLRARRLRPRGSVFRLAPYFQSTATPGAGAAARLPAR